MTQRWRAEVEEVSILDESLNHQDYQQRTKSALAFLEA